MSPPLRSLAQQTSDFWARVDKRGGPEACWPFTGAAFTGSRGGRSYGAVRWLGKVCKAHRVAYELAVGPIVPGLVTRHFCHNPPCCNPAHLSLGTPADNRRDMLAAKRERCPGAVQDVSRRNQTLDRLLAGEPALALAVETGISRMSLHRQRTAREGSTPSPSVGGFA